jgi:WD40 repeat protein/serine/threonine protein kinase
MAARSRRLRAFLDLPPELRRIGPFRLLEPLGKGGFAPVWRAAEVYGGVTVRLVAIKLFAIDEGRERVIDEARALCSVEHPNVVRFFSLLEEEAYGLVALAMEYAEGAAVSVGPSGTGELVTLPLEEALEVGVAVASALSVIHRAGLVHRDVKPANVVRAHDVYKLIDFGIAAGPRAAHTAFPPSSAPPSTVVVGDVPLDLVLYDAPSLRAGAPSEEPGEAPSAGTFGYVDPACAAPGGATATAQSDLYALGAMLFECLTGYVPAVWAGRTHGGGVRTEVVIGQEPAPSLADAVPSAPAALVRVVDALLAPREQRPRSAEVVARELETIRAGLGDRARALPDEARGPFRGLDRFEESDRDVFFGRRAEQLAALELLRTRGVVAILGESGSGKSSLARAAVAPAVVDGALARWPGVWDVVVVIPGATPTEVTFTALRRLLSVPAKSPGVADGVESLVRALAQRVEAEGRGVLLVVDQLEELVTHATEASRAGLVELLVALGERPPSGVRALVTVRRDHFDALLGLHPGLGRALARGALPIAPMTAVAWSDALDQALAVYGYRCEDEALREEIGAQIAATASAMPLVQFGLRQLWQARDREAKLLRRASFVALGGLGGALDRHAEQVRAACLRAGADDETLRALFLALTSAGGTRVTRSHEELSRLGAGGPGCAAAIRAFEEARLLARDGDQLTLAHEAIARHWVRLSRWLDEAREDRALAEEIGRDAARWAEAHEEAMLWRGRRLSAAAELLERRPTELDAKATEFVVASRRALRLRRTAAFASAALLLIGGALMTVRYVRGLDRARREAEAAQQRAEAAATAERSARELAEQATLGEKAVRTASMAHKQGYEHAALALALENAAPFVARKQPMPTSVADALIYAVTLSSTVAQRGHTKSAHVAAFSRDGELIVTGGRDRAVRVWDARDGRLYATHLGHAGTITSLDFAPDGKTIASAAVDGTIRIWPTLGGAPKRLEAFDVSVTAAALSPDGTRVLAGSARGGVGVWDVASGARTLTASHGSVWGVEWSRDGAHVVVASGDGYARVWSPTGASEHEFQHPDEVQVAHFSPDGTRLLTACSDQRARIFQLDAKSPSSLELPAGRARLEDAIWSPDGATVALADDDGELRTFDARSGKLLHTWREHQATIFAVVFSPDGQKLATASKDRTVRLLRADGQGASLVLSGHAEKVIGVTFSPSGDRLLSFGQDPVPRLWSSDGGALVATLSGVPARPPAALRAKLGAPGATAREPSAPLVTLVGHGAGINSVAFSADGARLATASNDLHARTWNAKTGAAEADLAVGKQVNAVAFAKDGARVAVAADEPTLRIWSPQAPPATAVRTLTGHRLAIYALAWSPAGPLATCGEDGDVLIWNAEAGSLVRKLGNGNEKVCRALALSADGHSVLAGTIDGTLRLLDVETGGVRWGPVAAHRSWIQGVAFSPVDPSRVVSVGIDQFVRSWSVGRSRPLVESDAHADWVHTVTFSADGARLLTAGSDRTARIWRADDLTPLATFEVPGRATAAAFSPSADAIAIGVEDGVGRVYPTDPMAYFTIGCALLRDLPEQAKVASFCGSG